MRRAWLGVAVLALVLGLALVVTWGMDWLHAPIAQDLEAAAAAVVAGEPSRALRLADRAEAQWTRWTRLRGCFCDHGPTEDADAAFAALRIYGDLGEESDFAALCGELARKVRAVSEAHALNWWNLF